MLTLRMNMANTYLQKQPPAVFSMQKGLLRNFTKFTGKHLFIKKETLAQVFSYEFCEISKNTFFTEHLWTTDPLLVQIKL